MQSCSLFTTSLLPFPVLLSSHHSLSHLQTSRCLSYLFPSAYLPSSPLAFSLHFSLNHPSPQPLYHLSPLFLPVFPLFVLISLTMNISSSLWGKKNDRQGEMGWTGECVHVCVCCAVLVLCVQDSNSYKACREDCNIDIHKHTSLFSLSFLQSP